MLPFTLRHFAAADACLHVCLLLPLSEELAQSICCSACGRRVHQVAPLADKLTV